MVASMIQNKQVVFRTIVKGQDRPSNHGNSNTINDKQVTVNVTTISTQTTIRDFGISNAKMITVRSITDLPTFDFVIVDNIKYKLYASQSIEQRRNLTLIEVDA